MQRITYASVAGGGKTTRCASSILEWTDRDGLTLQEWGYFSFMKRNIDDIMKRLPPGEYPHVRTYHSAAMELAGVRPEQVADEGWAEHRYSKDARYVLQRYHAARSRRGYLRERRRPTLRETYDALLEHEREEIHIDEFRRLIESDYLPKLARSGKVDFTDVLFAGMEARGDFPLRRVIADEAQDNTRLMNEFLDAKLAACAELLVLSGDLNQSICSFQGAEYGVNRDRFEAGEVEEYNVSYRCPWPVLEAAKPYSDREHVSQARVAGAFLRVTDRLPIPREGENLILCRDNTTIGKLSRRLAEADILFRGGVSPLTPDFCRTMDALLRGLDGALLPGGDLSGVLQMLKHTRPKELVPKIGRYLSHLREMPGGLTPLAGVRPDFVMALKKDPLLSLESASSRNPLLGDVQIAYVREMYRRFGGETFSAAPGTELNTIHGAKGGGRRHVHVCCKTVPAYADGRAADPGEERRVRYVALTRTEETCSLFGLRKSNYTI